MAAERKTLTTAQAKKLSGVVESLTKSLKVKGDQVKNLERYADKYARFKLNIRGTGPHSHGFNATQRKAIMAAVREAFGIKAPERKASKPKAAPKKRQPRKPKTQAQA